MAKFLRRLRALLGDGTAARSDDRSDASLGSAAERAERSAEETGEAASSPLPYHEDDPADISLPAPPGISVGGTDRIKVGGRTDRGRVRDHNEDAILVMTSYLDAVPSPSDFGLFMVADGMGGHQNGEAASALALRISASQLVSQVYVSLLSDADRGANQPALTDIVRDAVVYANHVVSHELPGSGCTLTCGIVVGERLFVGHVGDSRAYLRRADGELIQLTDDHSLVHRLIEIGQLSPEEAAHHPQRNVLYRAIGQLETLEVDVVTQALVSGDRLLFCSDGLWNLVSDEAISDMAGSPDLQAGCDALVDAANAAGGTDNISVVLVALGDK